MTTDLDAIDAVGLSRWLDDNVPSLGDGPLQMSLVSGGSTNLIVSLDRGERPAIFRSPPLIASPQGAKTIQREATVLRALQGTSVPHPAFHGYCPDPEVAGLPFYVMDQVDGWAAHIDQQNVTTYPPQFSQGPDLHYLGYAMIDGLAEMANLDYRAIGLESFGKPEGFLDRQVDRWLGQLAGYPKQYPKYEVRQLEGLDEVATWLKANVPAASAPGLMHGDYALNNVLFAHRPPARLVAIIDWETATIGDPVLDLAAFTQNFRDGDEQPGMSYFDATQFPQRSDVLAYYAELTGRDVSGIDYYYVLTKFRSACMIEYKVAEAIQGLAPKAKGDRFDGLVRQLLVDARDLTRSLG